LTLAVCVTREACNAILPGPCRKLAQLHDLLDLSDRTQEDDRSKHMNVRRAANQPNRESPRGAAFRLCK